MKRFSLFTILTLVLALFVIVPVGTATYTVMYREIDGTSIPNPGASDVNMTEAEYASVMDDLYDGYLSGQYSSSGYFTADIGGADGDGYTSAAAFSYINSGFLSYAGTKAGRGKVSSTITTRANAVIDKMFASPVWCTGYDMPRSINCSAGTCASPTCAASDAFTAGQMATRSDVFSMEAYVGAYMCWLNYANLGIGSTRRDLLKSFIDDTINQTPSGFGEVDLSTKPIHLYVKHLAGTSQVSNFSTLAGDVSGWGLRFDTAASVLPYVTGAFAWNYEQASAQTASTGFQTLEYHGDQFGAAAYENMVAAGSTPSTTSDARLRAMGLRMMGNLSHNGWPSGWLTTNGNTRQDLPGYAIGWALAGLDNVMSNRRLFTDQERRWAKYLFDQGIHNLSLMDTFNSDASDGMINSEPFGAAVFAQEQDGDKAVAAGHIMRAIAWHIILGNDTIQAETPPNLAWYDWQQNTLVLSTPVYATYLYADIEGTYAYGSNSSTYDSASGAHNLGFLTYVPTNEHVMERPPEGQISTNASSLYSTRVLENGLLIFNPGATPGIIDEVSSSSFQGSQLRPLMKTDAFSVRGWGINGLDSSNRPTVNFDPIWQDGSLIATSTIDRSDDSDAGFDDYKDVVTYTFHDSFIEEQHNVTAPGGACTTCFAFYNLRPPNNGTAYLTHATRLYDPTSTIGVRYEVQSLGVTDRQPTTITSTGASFFNMGPDTSGCVVTADGCTGNGVPNACCTAADSGTGCRADSAAGVVTSNTRMGSVLFNTNVTVTLTHAIDADMGVTAAANNRIKYRTIGRKFAASANHLVTLDGGTQRSKSAAGGDTDVYGCFSAGEVDGDYQAVIYDSSSDDAATIMTAGTHTLAVTNSTANDIVLDAFEVVSQSPARFLDNETAGGWVPPAQVPSGDNDWYIELLTPNKTAGYIAWFPDKTLITKGIEARYVRSTSLDTRSNSDPNSVVAMKLYGDNYGHHLVADSYTTVPAFTFGVEYYPFNGDHHEAARIFDEIIKWRPRVRAFNASDATLTISVNEIGIDVTPATKVNVHGLDNVGAVGVQLDYANDDIIITRSDTTTSAARISWRVEK